MKLTLKNFGCHRAYTLETPDKGLILLSGESGRGKSTMFRAIAYALFGKVRQPCHFGTTSCSVSLSWQLPDETNIQIIRTTKPNTLKVHVNEDEYEGDSAQGTIETILNTSAKTFELATYCPQGTNASLLSSSPADQLAFLQSLADTGSSNEIKMRLRKQLSDNLSTQEKIRTTLDVKRDEVMRYEKLGSGNHIENESDSSVSDIQQLITKEREREKSIRTKISTQKSLLATSLKNIEFYKDALAKKESNERELRVLKEMNLKPIQPSELASLNDRGRMLQGHLNKIIERDSLLRTRIELNRLKEEHFKSLEEKISELSQYILSDDEEEDEEFEYSPEDVEEAKETFNSLCLFLKTQKEFQGVEMTIENVYDILMKHMPVYSCPCCSKHLAFENNTLVERTANGVLTLAFYELSSILEAYLYTPDESSVKMKRNASRQNRIKINEYREEIEKEVIPLSLYTQIKQNTENINNYSSTHGTEDATRRDIEENQNDIANIKAQMAEYSRISKRIQFLEDELLKCDNIPDSDEPTRINALLFSLNEEIALVSSRLEKLADELRIAEGREKMKRIQEQYLFTVNEVKVLSENLRHLIDTHAKLIKLQSITVKAEMITLERMIDILNSTASIYLNEMFEDKIDILLQTRRELLSGDERDKISLRVFYRGMEYNSIDHLSGGERQRANLAFLLAVCNIVGTPLLLLDECLNSLDEETHMSIVDYIRTFTENRLILVVSHEALEGKFDDIIEI